MASPYLALGASSRFGLVTGKQADSPAAFGVLHLGTFSKHSQLVGGDLG